MVLYIGIYIESDWLYHAEWVALSNGQSGSELAEYSSDIEQFEVIPCGSVIQCNITLQHRSTPCPSCGKISRRVHDYYRRTLKHAVLVENDLIVVYRKRRYYCTACQKPFPENNPFSLPGKRISQATVIRIMKLLKRESITFSTAAELTDVSTTKRIWHY